MVVTELVFVKRREALNAAARFKHDSHVIALNARGFLFATVVLLWRRKTVIHISAWTDISDIKELGQSRGHVVSVQWVFRHKGVQTRSVVYGAKGTWRGIATSDYRIT